MMLTTSKVSARRRVGSHLLYLAHTLPYQRELAAVSHCKSALDTNTGKLHHRAVPSAVSPADIPAGGQLELLAFLATHPHSR